MIRLFRTVYYAALVLAGIAALAAVVFFFVAVQDLPRVPEPLSRIIDTPPTEIFAAGGERLMVIGGREAIPINRVSQDFINAVVATEDHRFWKHHGIDKIRTVKALGITLFVPGKIQGASTITQQLAKNLFFSFRRSYMRKFRELLVALQVESRFSKEDILEAYINQIPFGARSHGIEQAARAFFGKTASELNLAESALLAGLPKSPTRYNPYRHWERAKRRQKIVLRRMVATGHISHAQAENASQTPIKLVTARERSDTGSYFLDMVIRDLETTYGTDVVHHGGLKVYTTLDPRLQIDAIKAIQKGLGDLDRQLALPPATGDGAGDEKPQGALVAVDTKSGALRALVGGRAYRDSAYNRAIRSQRQPGSGFKPFTYYAALEKLDLSPATLMVDQPVTIPVRGAADWQPRNFSRSFSGPMVLKMALMNSVNTIAAQLIDQVGPASVIDTARRCGITSPLQPVYSLALGTSGVSPLEMAGAFATFASGGIHHPPYWIARVEDDQGRILQDHIVSGQRVLEPDAAFQIVDMLQGVVDQGSGSVVRRLGFGHPAAGKTGTTNNYHDAWFTGFTPALCASVWVGFDRGGHALKDHRGVGVTGGRGAAPIWTAFMQQAMGGEPTRHFAVPPGIHFENVDPQTGRQPDALTRNSMRVALTVNQAPDGAVARGAAGTGLIPAAAGGTATAETPAADRIAEEDLPLD